MACRVKQFFLIVICFAASANALAHTYYVGLTDISLNEEKQRLEVIHLLTTHDLEHVLMEQHQLKLTAEHPKFEHYLKQLISQNFTLKADQEKLNLEWVGFEFDYDKIVIYQEVVTSFSWKTLEIDHQIMSQFFPQQVNTVNYQLGKSKGTLTFDQLRHSANITIN